MRRLLKFDSILFPDLVRPKQARVVEELFLQAVWQNDGSPKWLGPIFTQIPQIRSTSLYSGMPTKVGFRIIFWHRLV